MAKNTTRKKTAKKKAVTTLTHDEAKRPNIPTAEFQSVVAKDVQKPIRVAYERGVSGLEQEKKSRNRDLDPQLVWRGKDEKDWSDLVVQAPPLFIQEKVHPKVLIDDLLRRTQEERRHQEEDAANDPYKSLKTTLKAEINEEAWATLHSETSRPFDKPESGRIAVKVINHLGDEVMKVFRVE